MNTPLPACVHRLPSILSLIIFASPLLAADPFIHQQEQQKALEQQLLPPTPDVRLSAPTAPGTALTFPQETPCFPIKQVELSGQETLPHWLPLSLITRRAQGVCLGNEGINLLMRKLQNRLVDSGYVTTRVLAPAQDLNSGHLKLVVVPGLLRQVQLTPESSRYVILYSAFPPRAGQPLDLRDIEQGLENLQRLPTVQASMEILPGVQPGESDILLNRQQSRYWRVGASLDDSGTRSTGRYQAGLTLSLDNPLSLSDLFYLSGTHDLEQHGGKGTQNLTAHYSVPFGYWQAGLTVNDYDYHQTVAGRNEDYRYSGKSKNLDVQVSRVLHRNGSQKTTLSRNVMARESKTWIDDTEVEVQRRQTAGWKLGLQHRHYLPWATIDAGISYQRGTRWFSAQPAPEEYWGEATALSKILQMNAQIDVPFQSGRHAFHYNASYSRQTTNTPLTSQDQFAIGNRWTVRGFDGERTLSADRGWYVRNDLGWYLPLPGQEFYLGVDYGEIGGRGSDYAIGKHLAGGVTGLRGRVWQLNYDLFAGIPLSRPEGFNTDPLTLGFNLNGNY